MPAPDPDVVGRRPTPLDRAVRLMYGGAVLSLLGALLTVLTRDELRAEATGPLADGLAAPPGAVDAVFGVALFAGIAFGLLSAGVWVLMAVLNGRGAGWARVLATALGAATVLSFAVSLGRARPTATWVLELATAVVAGAVVWLLWRPACSRYYAAAAAARRGDAR